MDQRHRFEFEGRPVTLYKRNGSPAWNVEFVVAGKRYRKALGEDLVAAETLAKSAILAAQGGAPLPAAPRAADGAEILEAHGQRVVLRQSPAGQWSARARLALPGATTTEIRRDLGTADLAQARVFAANLVLRGLADAAGISMAAASAEAPAPVAPSPAAPEGIRLGQLFEVYLRLAPTVGARGGVRPRSAVHAMQCLRNLVAETLGISHAQAAEQPLEVLTPSFARRWKDAWLARYLRSPHGAEEERRRTALRSGSSVWRQACSVFNRWMLAAYRDRNLVIPACVQEFMREPLWPSVRDEYRPADDATVSRTFEAARAFEAVGPQRDMAVAFWLAVGAGLRRGDIARIRWDEIVQREGRWWIASDAQGKDGERIDVPLLDEAAQALLPLREPGRQVLRHNYVTVARWISSWMQSLGWCSTKRLHELRAWSICRVGMAHGLDAARMFARHKDSSVTLRKYGRYLKLQHLTISLPQ